MLEVARGRASAGRHQRYAFTQGDAQSNAFDEAPFDLVISRFGTMFADPVTVLTNLRSALRPGGRSPSPRQPLTATDWLMVPWSPPRSHHGPCHTHRGPGMFAQSDPDEVHATLGAAGFADPESRPPRSRSPSPTLTPRSTTWPTPAPADSCSTPSPSTPEAALSDVRVPRRPHRIDHVVLGGAILITTATTPA
jgi:hypothetical protein